VKPRILVLLSNDLVYDQRMARMAHAWTNHGYDVTLLGRRRRHSAPLGEKPYHQRRMTLMFDSGKLFYLELNVRLFFRGLVSAYDALCGVDLDTAPAAMALKRIKNKPYVYDAHELFPHVPEVSRRPRIQAFWQAVQDRVFARYDAAYTVGSAIAEYLEQCYQRPVGVVRNAPVRVGEPRYEPDADRFVLYQGALNEGRGLEPLLEAVQLTHSNLVLVGEGDLSATLRQQVADRDLSSQVKFAGFLRPEDLPAWTRRAYLGFNVSQNLGLSYYLSLNNKFFDYVQAGLPSLINDFPEYRALVSDFEVGTLLDAEPDQIAAHLNRLLHDDSYHLHLHHQCLEAAKEWTWEREAEKLNEIWSQVLPLDS
jgi:glycosyltransferase involved in cell wall biosynthesis